MFEENYTQYSINTHVTQPHKTANTHISILHTHTWLWFTPLVSRDRWRFVIVPFEGSIKAALPGPRHSVSRRFAQRRSKSCATRRDSPQLPHGTGSVYQLCANTLNETHWCKYSNPCCMNKFSRCILPTERFLFILRSARNFSLCLNIHWPFYFSNQSFLHIHKFKLNLSVSLRTCATFESTRTNPLILSREASKSTSQCLTRFQDGIQFF